MKVIIRHHRVAKSTRCDCRTQRSGNDDSPKTIEETRPYIRDFDRIGSDDKNRARELFDKMLDLFESGQPRRCGVRRVVLRFFALAKAPRSNPSEGFRAEAERVGASFQAHWPSPSRGPLLKGCGDAIPSNQKTKENLITITIHEERCLQSGERRDLLMDRRLFSTARPSLLNPSWL